MLARPRFLAGIGLLSCLVAATTVTACRNVPLLAPFASTIFLNASDNVVPLNGSTEITAMVFEGALGASTGDGSATLTTGGGPVHNGTVVTFTTTLGRLEPAEAKTVNGRASVRLVADGRSGVATIKAFSGSAALEENLTINIGAAAATRVTVTASPQALPGTGGSSLITARVEDQQGNGLRGVLVSFSTSAGNLSETSAQTGEQGTATTTLTTTQAATVKATTGGVAGTEGAAATLTGEVAITLKPRNSVGVSVAAPTVGVPATVTLTSGTGALITDVSVDFGDGVTSGNLGPMNASETKTLQHAFRSPGQKTITARATDAEGGISTTSTLAVVAPLTLTVATSSALQRNAIITFTATPTTGALIEKYVWDFGDGSAPQTTQSNQAIKTFPNVGYYVITVTATPTGGGTTATAQMTIFIPN